MKSGTKSIRHRYKFIAAFPSISNQYTVLQHTSEKLRRVYARPFKTENFFTFSFSFPIIH